MRKFYKPADLERLRYGKLINLHLKNHGVLYNVQMGNYYQPFILYRRTKYECKRPASVLVYLYNGEHIDVFLPNIKGFEVLEGGRRFSSPTGKT